MGQRRCRCPVRWEGRLALVTIVDLWRYRVEDSHADRMLEDVATRARYYFALTAVDCVIVVGDGAADAVEVTGVGDFGVRLRSL